MSAFPTGGQTAAAQIEVSPPLLQLGDAGRRVGYDRPNNIRMPKLTPRPKRVLHVQIDAIVSGQGRGDSTLSLRGGRVLQCGFGDQQHVARFRGFDRRPQTGHARADHQHVAEEMRQAVGVEFGQVSTAPDHRAQR